MNGIKVLLVAMLIPAATLADQDRPAALQGVGIDQRLGEVVPLELVFHDESGQAVKLGHYFGSRPVVLALVYYECPMLCTLTLNGLVRTMNALPYDPGSQYDVITVSFNPHETPVLAAAKKKEYLTHFSHAGGAAGWHFLTGDEASIRDLTKAVGFHYNYDEASRQYAHAAGLVILTPDGRIARYFYGVEYSPRDLRLALNEASNSKIGSPVDVLLLFCFHYDPLTGKYGLVVTRVLQLAAALTIVFLGGFMALMIWRERRGTLHRLEAG